MLADIWSATVASSPGTTSTCGPCSTTTCPAATRCPGAQGRTDRQPGHRDGRVPSGQHRIAPFLPSASKTIKSDAIHLLDLLESPFAPRNFDLPPEAIGVLWKHTHRFLERLIEVGYDEWPKIPILIDWNLGNFSVDTSRTADSGCTADGTTTGFASSRDCSTSTSCRVSPAAPATAPVSPTVRTHWSSRRSSPSSTHTAACFRCATDEVAFLPEVYRFFILNYVVREGARFFRPDLCTQFRRDAVRSYLPAARCARRVAAAEAMSSTHTAASVMAAQPSRVVAMRSPQREERRFDVIVSIGQHAADDQHAGRRHDPSQIVGKFDQSRREDVGDDDVERVRRRPPSGVVETCDAIRHAVRRGVGPRIGTDAGAMSIASARDAPSTHAHTASTPDPQPTSSTVASRRTARPQRPHRQHRGRVIAQPERRRRLDAQHRHVRLGFERHPRRTITRSASIHTGSRGHARCRRPTHRPRRIATPTRQAVCRRGSSTTSTSSPSEVHSSTRVSRPRAPRWRRRRATTAHQMRVRRRLRSPRQRARALVDASQRGAELLGALDVDGDPVLDVLAACPALLDDRRRADCECARRHDGVVRAPRRSRRRSPSC